MALQELRDRLGQLLTGISGASAYIDRMLAQRVIYNYTGDAASVDEDITYHRYQQEADQANAADTLADQYFAGPFAGAQTVNAITILPGATGLTADATNYGTIVISKEDGAVGGKTALGTLVSDAAGGTWVTGTEKAVTVAVSTIAAGDVLCLDITKAAAGVVVPSCVMEVQTVDTNVAAAVTQSDVYLDYLPSAREIRSITLIPNGTLTADATNYATLTIETVATTLATLVTNVAGGSWVAGTAKALTLTTDDIAALADVKISITKAAAGVVVPPFVLAIEYT